VLPFSALLQLHAKSPSQFPHMQMAERSMTENRDSNKPKIASKISGYRCSILRTLVEQGKPATLTTVETHALTLFL